MLALLVALGIALACGGLRTMQAETLQQELHRRVKTHDVPGLSMAVVRGEETVFLGAAGKADLATGQPATADTVYMLFSVSKVFTAVAVMQLHERGLLDIDDAVADHLPALGTVNPFPRTLTIRHLLNHSSGLRDPIMLEGLRPADEARPPLREQLERLLADHGMLWSEPGARQSYSNVGYLVLGVLVETVSGRRFDQYVRENILEPLGMDSTGYVYDEVMEGRRATGYVARGTLMYWIGRRFVDQRLLGPEVGEYGMLRPYIIDGMPYAGLMGTARDLARFMAALLGDGRVGGVRILEQDTVREMLALQRRPNGWPWPYGIAWYHDVLDGHRYHAHSGIGGGFRPEIRIYPELELGTVVLANRSGFDPEPLDRTTVPSPATTAP